jgi:hypothetical protein
LALAALLEREDRRRERVSISGDRDAEAEKDHEE